MLIFRLFTLAILLFPMMLSAQEEQETALNPMLTDTFTFNAGMFFPEKEFGIQVDGQVPGDDIDFGQAFKLRESDSTWALNLRWRFGEKWSLFSQYWSLSDTAKATLDEDIHWEDVVFEEGTFVKAGTEIDVARFFFGRKFSSSPRHEFGLGAGLHWLELGASLEGQIRTNMGDTELYRGKVEADAPLPNIGAWYLYALSPRWALNLRADWLSASIGDYSGGLTNIGAGLDWAFSDHLGVGLAYFYFTLDLDVKKKSWKGSTELTQHGPFVQVRASW